MAKRFVVQHQMIDADAIQKIQDSPHWTDSQKQDIIQGYANRVGMYEKLGGNITSDITEANIIGWKNHSRWDRSCYKLIPVKIVVE